MVNRVLAGNNFSGQSGFWVSQPGVDVTVANIMQMAFSSDVKALKLVAKGQISIGPIAAVAPFGSTPLIGGAIESTATVSYGTTISPAPFVAAVATAPSWPLPLTVGGAQYSFLNGQWHTYAYEAPPFLGRNYNGVIIKRTSPPQVNGDVNATWASIKFISRVFSTGVTFATNCQNTVTIKYLIMEQP